jgi:putative transposase
LLAAAPDCAVFIGDTGYDAAALRQQGEDRGARVVIPSNPQRKHPFPFDPAAYRARNAIERLFCRLKDWRRLATRYDRLAPNFASTVALAATILCWCN